MRLPTCKPPRPEVTMFGVVIATLTLALSQAMVERREYLKDEDRLITSENYPAPYPPRLHFTWLCNSTSHLWAVVFLDFHLDPPPANSPGMDYLELDDGHTRLRYSSTSEPYISYKSTSHSLRMTFISDSHSVDKSRGFKVQLLHGKDDRELAVKIASVTRRSEQSDDHNDGPFNSLTIVLIGVAVGLVLVLVLVVVVVLRINHNRKLGRLRVQSDRNAFGVRRNSGVFHSRNSSPLSREHHTSEVVIVTRQTHSVPCPDRQTSQGQGQGQGPGEGPGPEQAGRVNQGRPAMQRSNSQRDWRTRAEVSATVTTANNRQDACAKMSQASGASKDPDRKLSFDDCGKNVRKNSRNNGVGGAHGSSSAPASMGVKSNPYHLTNSLGRKHQMEPMSSLSVCELLSKDLDKRCNNNYTNVSFSKEDLASRGHHHTDLLHGSDSPDGHANAPTDSPAPPPRNLSLPAQGQACPSERPTMLDVTMTSLTSDLGSPLDSSNNCYENTPLMMLPPNTQHTQARADYKHSNHDDTPVKCVAASSAATCDLMGRAELHKASMVKGSRPDGLQGRLDEKQNRPSSINLYSNWEDVQKCQKDLRQTSLQEEDAQTATQKTSLLTSVPTSPAQDSNFDDDQGNYMNISLEARHDPGKTRVIRGLDLKLNHNHNPNPMQAQMPISMSTKPALSSSQAPSPMDDTREYDSSFSSLGSRGWKQEHGKVSVSSDTMDSPLSAGVPARSPQSIPPNFGTRGDYLYLIPVEDRQDANHRSQHDRHKTDGTLSAFAHQMNTDSEACASGKLPHAQEGENAHAFGEYDFVPSARERYEKEKDLINTGIPTRRSREEGPTPKPFNLTTGVPSIKSPTTNNNACYLHLNADGTPDMSSFHLNTKMTKSSSSDSGEDNHCVIPHNNDKMVEQRDGRKTSRTEMSSLDMEAEPTESSSLTGGEGKHNGTALGSSENGQVQRAAQKLSRQENQGEITLDTNTVAFDLQARVLNAFSAGENNEENHYLIPCSNEAIGNQGETTLDTNTVAFDLQARVPNAFSPGENDEENHYLIPCSDKEIGYQGEVTHDTDTPMAGTINLNARVPKTSSDQGGEEGHYLIPCSNEKIPPQKNPERRVRKTGVIDLDARVPRETSAGVESTSGKENHYVVPTSNKKLSNLDRTRKISGVSPHGLDATVPRKISSGVKSESYEEDPYMIPTSNEKLSEQERMRKISGASFYSLNSKIPKKISSGMKLDSCEEDLYMIPTSNEKLSDGDRTRKISGASPYNLDDKAPRKISSGMKLDSCEGDLYMIPTSNEKLSDGDRTRKFSGASPYNLDDKAPRKISSGMQPNSHEEDLYMIPTSNKKLSKQKDRDRKTSERNS